MRLKDRTALITGGGSGIGRAAAHRFAAEGARVVIVDIDANAARSVAEELGGECVALSFDVSSAAGVDAAMAQVRADLGGLDVVVNNAGIEVLGAVQDLDEATWDRVLAVNLKGAFLVSKAAWPLLVERGRGAIVNTASTAALTAFPGDGAYNASKAGVLMLTRTMALEGAPAGIRVNCVCPGMTDTPLMRSFMDGEEEFDLTHATGLVPLGRLARPEDIADAMLFLASDEAAYVTGIWLTVDGGLTAGYWPGPPGDERQ